MSGQSLKTRLPDSPSLSVPDQYPYPLHRRRKGMFLRNGRQFVKAFESKEGRPLPLSPSALSSQQVVVAAGKCLFYKFKEAERPWLLARNPFSKA